MKKIVAHKCHSQDSSGQQGITRRNFLRLSGVATAGILLASCKSKATEAISGTKQARVAIGKAKTYERTVVERQLAQMIEQLGGLGDVVKPGDRVAIKVNLTGGTKQQPLPGVSAIESYITHPEVVRALVKQVQAAGAKEIFIVESVYEWASYKEWGFEEVAADTGATLIDLNNPKPYNDFSEVKVENSFIYPSFNFNPLLTDVDVYMSVSKMKNHYEQGVTHTIKNAMGLAPLQFYEMKKGDGYRSAIHGPAAETRKRLPGTIIDLNKARPINFSLIDGIKTAEAGEGPWIATMTPVEPGVLFAGKNPVSTDAVATAAMGYDPTTDYPNEPFIRGDNHLNLAAAAGMGTNKIDDIEVVGATIEEVLYPFTPAR
jgi:uncharacterized protein (DUF362 family)